MSIGTSILIILIHGTLAGAFGLALCGAFVLLERALERRARRREHR